MALIHSLEKNGNFLFRFRGQIPVVVFITAIPVIFFSDYTFLTQKINLIISVIAVFVSFSGLIIRSYTIGTTPKGTSGRNTKEQVAESLNSKGIYSVVRHPLYLGNYLMWLGLLIFCMNIYYVIIVSLMFWLYYERIMFAEERFLERKYGEQYIEWSKRVPAFLPSFKNFLPGNISFSFITVLRREYSGVLAIVSGFVYVDILRFYAQNDYFEWNRMSLYVLIITALIALVLRTLKHKGMLNEEGRS